MKKYEKATTESYAAGTSLQDTHKAPLGLYVHLPFCVRKCLYCDFLSGPATEDTMRNYCRNLSREMALWAEDERICNRKTDTVFFGGGTPSLLEPAMFLYIMESIRTSFSLTEDAEISLECNPGTVNLEKLQLYREQGVNRLSIGMQSMHDPELEALGRIHRRADFIRVFQEARKAGFENINVDIMSAIPGQTFDRYTQTLEEVIALAPEHISSYSLILEEGTPFYEQYREAPPVDEETDRAMYEQTGQMLEEAGYHRYEISNYARPGYECRHNLKYWKRKEYIGTGIGAASFLCEKRISNQREMDVYESCVKEGELPAAQTDLLTREDAMAEFMYLGLRCMEGISVAEFAREFDIPLEEVYGDLIDSYSKLGMLVRRGDRLALTKRGIDVSNVIFADFLLD